MFDKIFQRRFERKEQRFEQILQNDLVYLKEFAWLNTSPNHKFFLPKGKEQKVILFSLCSCFSCKSMIECLS